MTGTEPDTPELGPITTTVVTYDDAPDECTIHPANVSVGETTTAWISAEEGSFISIEDSR